MLTFLLFVFLFFNIYCPISFHYAMIINFLLLLAIRVGYKKSTATLDKKAIVTVSILLLYSFIITFFRTGTFALDLSVNFIYFLLCVLSYPYIIDFFIKKGVNVLPTISVVLSIHCVIIILEVISPEFSALKSLYFDYNRDDIDKFLLMDYRKMGLATSFDTSGYFATLSTILAFLLFLTKGKVQYLLVFLISAASSLATSRSGMILTFLGVISSLFLFKGQSKNNKRVRFVKIVSIIAIIYFGANILLPIVGEEFGIKKGGSDYAFVTDIQDNYSVGSVDGLLTDHQAILYKLSFDELLLGTGQIFRKVQKFGKATTDVGYIRQIFEIGLVGTSLMLVFLFNNWNNVRKKYRKNKSCFAGDKDNMVVTLFLYYAMVLVCLLFMNYKNVFIFDRGKFEIYLLIYYILMHYLIRGDMCANIKSINNKV